MNWGSSDRRFQDCGQAIFTKTSGGVQVERSSQYKGTNYNKVTYNMACADSSCVDASKKYNFEVVYYN